jgi:glycosyltransferase involved in cell wall biosynthesis
VDVALVNGSRRFDGHYAGHFLQYIAALRRAAVPFRIYTCVDPSLDAQYPDDGIRVPGLRVPLLGSDVERTVNRFFPVFPRRLRSISADIVHANDVYLARLAAYRDDVVATVADLGKTNTRYYPRGASALHNLSLRYLKRCRAVICHTQTVRRDLVSTLGLPDDRVHTVTPAAWDLRAESEPRAPPDPPSERVPWTLLYVATDRPHKRLDRFASLVGGLDARFRATLVSRLSPARAETLRRLAGGPQRLRVASEVTDLDPEYRRAQLFLFPSVYEGFGFPPLEAMSRAVPVLASRASCLPEVVGDGGTLLDPDDDRAWRDEILRLASDPAAYREASRRALARARTFSPDRTVRELLAAYEAAGLASRPS